MFTLCLHLHFKTENRKKTDTSLWTCSCHPWTCRPVSTEQLILKFHISILMGSHDSSEHFVLFFLCVLPWPNNAWHVSPAEETRKLLCPMSCSWMMGRMGVMVTTMPWKTSWLAVSWAPRWCVHSEWYHRISSKWCREKQQSVRKHPQILLYLLQSVAESRANGTSAIICRYTGSIREYCACAGALQPDPCLLCFTRHSTCWKQSSDLTSKKNIVCLCVFGIDCNPMHMASQYITPCKPLPSSKWKAPQIKLRLALCYQGLSGFSQQFFFPNFLPPFPFFLILVLE